MKPQDELCWASEPCFMGIDEAGRGPVLGPMVYGVAFGPLRLKDSLKSRSFADSKTLTEEKREALFSEVEADADLCYAVDSISSVDISEQMCRREKTSLNVIANESTFKLIEQVLAKGVDLKEVYCDTVGDAKKWQDRLTQRFPAIKFTVCPKADSLYPIVSAASIMAKVTRDRELRDFKVEDGLTLTTSFGSGYPGDPVTKAWLRSNMDTVFGFPNIVRFSWATAVQLLKDRAAAMSWECDDALEPGQTTLDTRKRKAGASSGAGRHSFFLARKLQRVQEF